jgi:hypothetical protein
LRTFADDSAVTALLSVRQPPSGKPHSKEATVFLIRLYTIASHFIATGCIGDSHFQLRAFGLSRHSFGGGGRFCEEEIRRRNRGLAEKAGSD